MNINALKKIMLDHMTDSNFNRELMAVLGISYATAAGRTSGRYKFRKSEKELIKKHYKLTDQQEKEVFGSDEK